MVQDEEKARKSRSAKLILLFAMVSMTMMFAGLTSAFVVSKSRADWLKDFQLPDSFVISTIVIMISSLSFILAKRALKRQNQKATTIWLLVTLLLGAIFIFNQFNGFQQIINQGYNFTGPTSNVTMSYIYLIAMVHILHVVVGLICLLVVIYNHFKQKYNSENMLGFELAATFWHFIDILWIYLFLFLYFVR